MSKYPYLPSSAPMSREEPIRVLITSAGSQLSQALAMLIAAGAAFGPKQQMVLHLIDVPALAHFMEGLQMELSDMAYPLLQDVITTSDPVQAFKDISVAFLVSGKQQTANVTRRELIEANCRLFKDFGLCLDEMARPDCKVMVVTDPTNTMAYVCSNNTALPRENITALARLIYNRTVALLAKRFNVPPSAVTDIIIWGNDSGETAYPDISRCKISIDNVMTTLSDLVAEDAFFRNEIMEKISKRGAEIVALRQQPTSISAAKAACDQMYDWWLGTKPGQCSIMGVYTDGAYSSPKDTFFSLPVEVQRGHYVIYKYYKLDEFCKTRIDVTGKELLMEKATAMAELHKDF